MAYFPFMIEIGDRSVLVVGGGRSAFLKVRALLGFGAKITVVAKAVSPDISRLSGEIVVWRRAFRPEDLEGCAFVIAATDDKNLNRRIAEAARQAGILANAVDDKESCDFIFPAILKKENYTVAISTDGRSPMLAGRIKKIIAKSLPDNLDEAVGDLGRMREEVLKSTASSEERSRIFSEEIERRLGRRKIRIGTRSSALAMAQTELVMKELASRGIRCEAVVMRTEGDMRQDRPLWDFGGKAVFVSEFEEAILSGRIDLAIHSAKDMSGEIPESLDILACLEREDPRDVIVSLSGRKPEDIRIVGTSSMRRKAMIENLGRGYETRSLRGNVPTRLTKLRRGEFDAVVLAAAGLKRLGLDDEPDLRYEFLDEETFIPSAGQGVIAVEGLGNSDISGIVRSIDDRKTSLELRTERKLMHAIGAGCHDAVAALARCAGDGRIRLIAMRSDEGRMIRADVRKDADRIDDIVREAATTLLDGE